MRYSDPLQQQGSADLHRVRNSSKQSRAASQPVAAPPPLLPSAAGGRVVGPVRSVQQMVLQAAVEETTMRMQGPRGMAAALCDAAYANMSGEHNAQGMDCMDDACE